MNVLSELQNLFESFKCRSSVDVDLIKPISEIEKLPVKNAKFVGLLTFIQFVKNLIKSSTFLVEHS